MASSSKMSRDYRVASFMVEEQPRFIFQRYDTLEPSVAVSLYEANLSFNNGSFNSVKDDLDKLTYLYSWALEEGIDLDEMLLQAVAPEPVMVRSFAHWLSERISFGMRKENRKNHRIGVNTYNRILDTSADIFCWFVQYYGKFKSTGNEHAVEREQVRNYIQKLFRSNKKKSRSTRIAEDLSEEEIVTVEQYLKPENRKNVDRAIAVRDYLIWRLAVEFGLRIGEILALRLCDCPHEKQQHINIVRVEERGEDYHDPRGAYRPQPKTLTRELGFILNHTPIPQLLDEYVNEHRVKIVARNGRKTRQPIMEHKFVFIEHTRKSGAPLTSSATQRIAQKIAGNTGGNFHWHIARHSFFNRTYLATCAHKKNKDRLEDLAHWGGWADSKSLRLYINRARRFKAQTALIFWQEGFNTWEALQ